MEKKVAILQSNYIPWKGYFDLINMVDEFILYDDVQYTRRDWRNRNIIKTVNGPLWMSIPVEVKGKYLQKINATKIADGGWVKQHQRMLIHNYSKADFFRNYWPLLDLVYAECGNESLLSKVNFKFIQAICRILNIKTKISWSTDYQIITTSDKTERLVNLCLVARATKYISGPAAADYIDEKLFVNAGIKLDYIDYTGYPKYPQLFGNFSHFVTILDLIFNVGEKASNYMKSF